MRIGDVDLADGATFLSGPPHYYFDFLRREHPVAWVDHAELDGPGFWALTKWDDVMAVERDPETFSSYTGGAFDDDQPGPSPAHPPAQAREPDVHASPHPIDRGPRAHGCEGDRGPRRA